MPGQEDSFKNWDTYTTAPILIFQIQAYIPLNQIESMLLNYIVLHSINVFGVKNSNARNWIAISPSQFGLDRGYTRQAGQKALKTLLEYGLINSREVIIKTNSGAQKGREYSLISNKKMHEKYELLSMSAKPRGANSQLAPTPVENVVGANHQLAPRQLSVGTLTTTSWHLDNCQLAPWVPKDMLSLEKITPKDSLKTFKYFLKTYFQFHNSFFELYSTQLNSKSAITKTEMKIHALIRQYGAFSTLMAMTSCLFIKNAQIGNFDALKAFLELNKDKLENQEQNLILQSDNLFQNLKTVHENTSLSELKIFRENFRQNASVLLLNMEFDQRSNGIFMYEGFNTDVIAIFEECNFNSERFTAHVIKKLNLYFKAKLLGMKGLNFVQSLDH